MTTDELQKVKDFYYIYMSNIKEENKLLNELYYQLTHTEADYYIPYIWFLYTTHASIQKHLVIKLNNLIDRNKKGIYKKCLKILNKQNKDIDGVSELRGQINSIRNKQLAHIEYDYTIKYTNKANIFSDIESLDTLIEKIETIWQNIYDQLCLLVGADKSLIIVDRETAIEAEIKGLFRLFKKYPLDLTGWLIKRDL